MLTACRFPARRRRAILDAPGSWTMWCLPMRVTQDRDKETTNMDCATVQPRSKIRSLVCLVALSLTAALLVMQAMGMV